MKNFVLVLAALLLLCSFTWGQNGPEYPPDIQRIKDRGFIVVAMHPSNFLPYMFEDPETGELIGHEIDMAKNVAKEMGVELKLDREATSFNNVAERVAQGHADVAISLLSRTLPRAQFVRFTQPYIVVRPTIAIHRINTSVYNVDLNNPVESLNETAVKIAEPAGNSYVTIAKDIFPGVEVDEMENWDAVYQAVLNRDVTFALRSEVGVANFLRDNKDQQINLQMIPLDDEKYADPLAMAVHPDSVHLLHWLNIFIENNGGTITGEELLKQYEKYYQ